jgi:hypothetical protein
MEPSKPEISGKVSGNLGRATANEGKETGSRDIKKRRLNSNRLCRRKATNAGNAVPAYNLQIPMTARNADGVVGPRIGGMTGA